MKKRGGGTEAEPGKSEFSQNECAQRFSEGLQGSKCSRLKRSTHHTQFACAPKRALLGLISRGDIRYPVEGAAERAGATWSGKAHLLHPLEYRCA